MDVSPESVIDSKTPRKLLHWDNEKTLDFRVHFVNASVAMKLLGIEEIRTPINEELYKEYGVPFLDRYLEEEGVEAADLEAMDINGVDGSGEEEIGESFG